MRQAVATYAARTRCPARFNQILASATSEGRSCVHSGCSTFHVHCHGCAWLASGLLAIRPHTHWAHTTVAVHLWPCFRCVNNVALRLRFLRWQCGGVGAYWCRVAVPVPLLLAFFMDMGYVLMKRMVCFVWMHNGAAQESWKCVRARDLTQRLLRA